MAIRKLAQRAKTASRKLVALSAEQKNKIIQAMAVELSRARTSILEANKLDVEAAQGVGHGAAFLDRLKLDERRLDNMIASLSDVTQIPDPVGKEISRVIRPNGLLIKKVRVPIGVIAVIYEARPNVTSDAAVLCLKASNAVILRGGSEAIKTNSAIAQALQSGGEKEGLPLDAIQLVQTTDREAVRELVQLEGLVDLVVPRGGESLIKAITEWARVPVIKNAKGLCHLYVDKAADLEMALKICENAKCQRPGVCNAIETLLVHADVAAKFLPKLCAQLGARGVELRGDEAARKICAQMLPASEKDWETEYLDLILSVRVVPSLDAAIEHIGTYGSRHSEAIVTQDEQAARRFEQEVDAAAVYVNASTRFTDGGEFGMGAEIGISTDKLHARGPMGVEELTTYKYLVEGAGQVRG